MRLTLRTLLAYLDDTLEPAQAKLIGQKVAESDTAQELIARIKQVTRRRRLTSPPATGPGSKLDPNNVAEYLDNTLAPDQLAEVEQTCLGSDVHLAEIAACHQILTLVLGEPALIPPTSKQRMYGLVKGPEAIPFRRPAGPQDGEALEESGEHNAEADETLRLGLPAYRRGGSWSSRLTLLGGALAAVLLLALAIWQALRLPQEPESEPRAQNSGEPRTSAPIKVLPSAQPSSPREKVTTPEPAPKTTAPEPAPAPKTTEPGPEKVANPPTPEPKSGTGEKTTKPDKGVSPETGRVQVDVPVEPPSVSEREVGKYLALAADGPSLLLQRPGPKGNWRLLTERTPQVQTGKPLVSLPGSRSLVQLTSGLRLLLWGQVPEQFPFPPFLRESLVELHAHPGLDLDLTLRRGRIVLTNPEKKPLRVRIRLDNPTNPQTPEVWDLTLEEPGTEVLIDRWGLYPRGEPFYKDPNDPARKGPLASMHLIISKGAVSVHHDTSTVLFEAKSKSVPVLLWNSFKGTSDQQLMDGLPGWANPKQALPPGVDPKLTKLRDSANASLKALATMLGSGPDKVSTGLASAFHADDSNLPVLAVRCFGALDDLPDLIDALTDGDRPEVRMAATDTLRNWIAAGRDNDYLLLDELRNKKYLKGEAEVILSLLHNFSERDAASRETYELLIEYLDNPKLPIRELASWHLYALTGNLGAGIGYSATASPEQRRGAQQLWGKLLNEGKLPPRPMTPPAGAGS